MCPTRTQRIYKQTAASVHSVAFQMHIFIYLVQYLGQYTSSDKVFFPFLNTVSFFFLFHFVGGLIHLSSFHWPEEAIPKREMSL